MKKSLIAINEFEQDGNENFLVTYWLTEEFFFDGVGYGIILEKEKNGRVVEMENTQCFSYCKNRVIPFIRKLAKEKITPMTLIEIVDDFISLGSFQEAVEDILVG